MPPPLLEAVYQYVFRNVGCGARVDDKGFLLPIITISRRSPEAAIFEIGKTLRVIELIEATMMGGGELKREHRFSSDAATSLRFWACPVM